jgi:hypothetical protein
MLYVDLGGPVFARHVTHVICMRAVEGMMTMAYRAQ